MSAKPSSRLNPAPFISFITTCKGRLHHLKLTLPLMVVQSRAEVIVVDYGCPQRTAAWVRPTFDTVRVVEVTDDPGFCVARARNLGAAQARGEFLCFIDADMRLVGDFGAWIAGHVAAGSFYLAQPKKQTSGGTCVVAASDFARLEGYDEAFRDWGGEDTDFYERLRLDGCTQQGYPSTFIEPIIHGDEERDADNVGGVEAALHVQLLYRTIKLDLTRLIGKMPDPATRNSLMALVKKSVRRYRETGKPEHGQVLINVSLGMSKYQQDNFSRRLMYSLTQPGHSAGRGNYR